MHFQKIGGSSPSNSLAPGSKDISRSNTPIAMETGKQSNGTLKADNDNKMLENMPN